MVYCWYAGSDKEKKKAIRQINNGVAVKVGVKEEYGTGWRHHVHVEWIIQYVNTTWSEKMRLVQVQSRKPIEVGQNVITFRGEVVTLDSVEAPRHEGSTGRVYCTTAQGTKVSWYPSVIGAEFIEDNGEEVA